MLDRTKTDKNLGFKVNNYLKEKGVETPMFEDFATLDFATPKSKESSQISQIEKSFKDIMITLGLDLTDDSLEKTPHRVAKMFVSEVFWGLSPTNFPKSMTFENKMQYSQMVVETGISVKSACEHHFQPFVGHASIAYIPKGKVIGLSKLNRITEYFSRRPQVQERLTNQIANELKTVLETEDVAVIIDAKHLCVSSRGVKDDTSATVTTYFGGEFNSASKISELQNYLNN
jgi:GTP cyclohydrolase I